MPHGITQCYLPSGRGDILALTSAEAGTRNQLLAEMYTQCCCVGLTHYIPALCDLRRVILRVLRYTCISAL